MSVECPTCHIPTGEGENADIRWQIHRRTDHLDMAHAILAENERELTELSLLISAAREAWERAEKERRGPDLCDGNPTGLTDEWMARVEAFEARRALSLARKEVSP